MRSLFCRFNLNKHKIDSEKFNKSVTELSQYKNISKDIVIEENYGFGQIEFHTKQTSIFNNDPYTVLSDCRIDYKKELSDKLKTDIISDDDLLFKAFNKWGVDCPNYLLGDFAFIIWDKSSDEVFCARDHFGVKPVYYYFDNNILIISSEVKSILAQDDLSFTINKQYLADSLSIIKSEHDRTIYNEIKRLPPAHILHLKDNQFEVKRYWKLGIQKEIDLPETDIIIRFNELIFKSVQNRTQNLQTVGSELSGGLDSSSIAAVASRFVDIYSFSHIMPDDLLGKIHPFKDEREFIYELTDFCGIDKKEFITSESTGVLEALEKNLNEFMHISQQNFSLFSDQLYKSVNQQNISVLLSGFGGDEVITSKAGNYMEELAKNGNWNSIKKDLKERKISSLNQLKLWIKLILKAKIPVIYNLAVWIKSDKKWWKEKFRFLALNNEFLNEMNIKKRYHSYYKKINPPLFQERNIERITHPHVAQRLEYCNTSARACGIEYRYPFLDKELIEFYLSMPPQLKARKGINRYAIREAMKGVLPEKIRTREDKSGATIPTVFMRMVKDKELISEIISQAKSNTAITKYIDIEKYEKWFENMLQRSEKNKYWVNPGAFYNYLKLILFINHKPDLFNE